MTEAELVGAWFVDDDVTGRTTIETSAGRYVVDTAELEQLRRWAVVIGWRLGQVRRIDDD